MDIDYKSLIENIFDGLYLVDKDRSIIYWNHVAEKITGYRSEEVVGRRCRRRSLLSGKPILLKGSQGRRPADALLPAQDVHIDDDLLMSGSIQAIGPAGP